MQQLGGAIGVAAIGVIFFGQLTHYAPASIDAATPQLRAKLTAEHVPAAAQDAIIAGFTQCYEDRVNEKDSNATPASCKTAATSTTPGAPAASQVMTAAITDAAKTANNRNFTHAFKIGVLYDLGLLVLVAGLSFLLPRHIRPEAFQEG